MDSKILSNNLKSDFSSNRKEQKENFNFGVQSTFIALLSIISLLLLYYVWILNVNATKGYDIRDLEREKRELLIEKQALDAKISEIDSSEKIEDESVSDYMESSKNPEYLVIRDGIQYVYNN